MFPSFAHELKDPIFDDIEVTAEHKYIIIEGLYIYLKKYKINGILDLKILVQSEREILK